MKWVEILKELAPAITRVGFLFNPTTARGGGSYFRWRMAVSGVNAATFRFRRLGSDRSRIVQ